MSTEKSKLSDLGIPAQEYESTPLSTISGKTITVKEIEFKKLGTYDGVVFTLSEPVEVNGTKWNKIHSSSDRIVQKFKLEKLQNAIKEKPLEMTVITGKTGNGTWYDVE